MSEIRMHLTDQLTDYPSRVLSQYTTMGSTVLKINSHIQVVMIGFTSSKGKAKWVHSQQLQMTRSVEQHSP
jgi:hypothetical protein